MKLRKAQKLAEKQPDLLQLRTRSGRHNGDHSDQEPERTRDVSVETCRDRSAPRNLDKTPREMPQSKARPTGNRIDQDLNCVLPTPWELEIGICTSESVD